MSNKPIYIVFLILFSINNLLSQEQNKNEELKVVTEKVAVKKKKRHKKEKKIKPYEPLAPARAAFYSAILPGLGQAYNGKYWKIPIVYGAIGTGVSFYIWNNEQYNRVRDIYKARLSGVILEDGATLTEDQLIDIQQRYRKDQELSLLITVGLYVLNIVDANVTTHLQQFNVAKDLSLRPKLNINKFNATPNYGMSLSYNF